MVVHTCQSQSPNSFPLTTLCPLFVLYICISFPALQVSSSIPFFYIPHIYVLIYSICFFLSDLYFILYISRSIYNSTNDPILFLLWLSNTPLYMCTASLSIHLLLLPSPGCCTIVLQWTLGCICLFELWFSGYMPRSGIAGSWEGNGTPLQSSCLENPVDGGAWWAAVHGTLRVGQTRLSDFTFTFHFHALEKEMATHSSVLAWRIPGIAEPGGLLSMESPRVRHDWSDLAAAAALQLYLVF